MKEFKNFNEFNDYLDRIIKKQKIHSIAILETACKIIEDDAKRKFGIYQDAVGPFSYWPQLSPVTMEDRVRKGFEPDNPLYRTGELMNSIYHKVDPIKMDASVGSDDVIMVYQELGTPDAKHPIPPRPVLGPAAFENTKKIGKVASEGFMAWLMDGAPVKKKF